MTAKELTRLLARANRRVDDLEARLANVIRPILDRAGTEAAHRFTSRVTDHLTASVTAAASSPGSTMVALKPRPDEAAALEHAPGESAADLHVTLCFLGETDGPLVEMRDCLAAVAASHAPLAGEVGGIGAFSDNGDGHPGILLPDVPGMAELRQAVVTALASGGVDYARNHGWQPHMTVAYNDSGNIDQDRHGANQPSGSGSGSTGRSQEGGRRLSDLRSESIPGASTGRRRRSFDSGLQDRLGGDDRTYRSGPVGSSQVRERAVPERGAHGVDDQVGSRFSAQTSPHEVLDSQDTVRTEEQAREAAVLGMRTRGNATLSSEGIFPSFACLGQPLHFDSVQVVRGDQLIHDLPLTGPKPVTAAIAPPPPQWTAPGGDELIDVDALVALIRTKTDPVRLAVVETIMAPALESVGLSFDVTNPVVANVIESTGSQITHIAETTRANVVAIIAKAYQEGASIPDTAKLIRVGMRDASKTRALLIARTELVGTVHQASLAATKMVTEETGQTYYKQWMTAAGARHPRHELYEDLDGQTVELDDDFDVGGAALQCPGDPAGPADEVCNCLPLHNVHDGGRVGVDERRALDRRPLTPALAARASRGPMSRS